MDTENEQLENEQLENDPYESELRALMSRIREAEKPSDCDKEDLRSICKEWLALKRQNGKYLVHLDLNEPQVNTLKRMAKRYRFGSHTANIIVRKDAREEIYEADWLKDVLLPFRSAE